MPESKGIRRGFTTERDAAQAARDLHRQLSQDDLAAVILFCSPSLDFQAFGPEISRLFGDTLVIGCTTSGELTHRGYSQESVTGISLGGGEFHCVGRAIAELDSISVGQGRELIQEALTSLAREAPELGAENIFAFLMIDGLSTREETVVSCLHQNLGQIPLFGGSAGDDLGFQRTHVLFDGAFHPNAAVLLLTATKRPFRVFKTENFTPTEAKMVITGADPLRRIVTEINGEPAGEEYARLVGLDGEPLTPMIFAAYPVVVRIGGNYYVRSIQKVNADGSLTFFCAIDEGIVLTVARGEDLIDNLRAQFERLETELGGLDLVIGCDCILRRLELERNQALRDIIPLFSKINVVGFNTYGEQFLAMHVNQTFTGVAIGRAG